MTISDQIPEYYITTCPDTGRQFLCKAGEDNNIAELSDVDRFLAFVHLCLELESKVSDKN